MIRQIIQIDEEKCNGCGLCANACQEAALGIVNGKAKLLREDFCDGLGNCLPACPMNAITFVQREAPEFDEEAVKRHLENAEKPEEKSAEKLQEKPAAAFTGCPGMRAAQMKPKAAQAAVGEMPSMLSQWPVQIKLAGANAPYFRGCDLLIAADCTAYAYGDFHRRYISGRVTLIGCPKLDDTDYAEKLGDIISHNDIRSITVARMEVPCCGGIESAVKRAIAASGKDIPVRIDIISTDGNVIE